jgi:hypothetical protein
LGIGKRYRSSSLVDGGEGPTATVTLGSAAAVAASAVFRKVRLRVTGVDPSSPRATAIVTPPRGKLNQERFRNCALHTITHDHTFFLIEAMELFLETPGVFLVMDKRPCDSRKNPAKVFRLKKYYPKISKLQAVN